MRERVTTEELLARYTSDPDGETLDELFMRGVFEIWDVLDYYVFETADEVQAYLTRLGLETEIISEVVTLIEENMP